MRSIGVLVVVLLLFPRVILACIWDADTRHMEEQKFPEALDLISGDFVRHSPDYYKWRLADRLSIAVRDRTAEDYDDIAVAYDKLGMHDRAIATIREKMNRWQERGRYESEANLGTFLIHAGEYQAGLKHIRQAIEINPEAHFGREVYQQLLVEYVIARRSSGASLPVAESSETNGFASFVLASRQPSNPVDEIDSAITGVLGMLRFGKHDSPILLEALADLLLYGEPTVTSRVLAAQAYLKASYEAESKIASEAYQVKARAATFGAEGWPLERAEAELERKMDYADKNFRRIQRQERIWIEAGEDVDQLFAEKYYGVYVFRWNYLHSLATALLLCTGLLVTLVTLRKARIHKGIKPSGPSD